MKILLILALLFLISILVYEINHLMIDRPHTPDPAKGFVYFFFGKRQPVYVSLADYLELTLAGVSFLAAAFVATRVQP